MDVYKAIQIKRAVRNFQQKPIPEEAIITILNAGRRAQSAKNIQPWHFIAIRDKSTLTALSKLGTYAGHLAGAALAIAIITPDPASRFSVMFDAGQAAAYMQLAAFNMGIASCPATIYEPDKARELLAFPSDLYINVCLSFGYPLSEDDMTRPPQKGGRQPLDQLIHWEKW